MRRIAPWVLAAVMMISFCLTPAFAQDCTRDSLKAMIGTYFAALEAKDHKKLPVTANVRYTENGIDVPLGEGIWRSSGKVLLKWDLLDTFKCGTHSTTVINEPYTAPKVPPKPQANPLFGSRVKPPAEGTPRPILYGLRLKVEGDRISEIEAIIARETEFAFNGPAVLALKDQDWESIIPPAQRSSRLAMIAAADDYYEMFRDEPMVHTPFASPCDRWENGFFTTGGGGTGQGLEATSRAHDCSPKGLVITTNGPRRFLVDVEAGTVVAYLMFAGGLPDFHVFRMRNGKVDLIQAYIGSSAKDMGWPHEPYIRIPTRGSY